ncbi:MAG: nucleotidyltransferase domain-containing protein [Desulfomicrobium sp.]|nr:nucleotidyltransferase domain-containing protein [Desulfomicrobium sp.]MDP3428794.1 nucleotidyltransferase domain-containing protein [Desulfomicrobium sp.]
MNSRSEELIDTLKRIESIAASSFTIVALYLYGSRARGVARPGSDWDVGVLFSDYLADPVERALRPQELEALLERELKMYGLISVVDLENVPPPLQWNIINGRRFFDRGVPRVRRVEAAITSRIEKDYSHVRPTVRAQHVRQCQADEADS